jgi:hypothetical protein
MGVVIDPEKNRARNRRYNNSEKGRARHRRFDERTQSNARRIRICERYVGQVASVTEAAAIKAHIKGRRLEFQQRLAERAQIEGDSLGTVQAEATPGSNRLAGGSLTPRD